MRQKLLQNPSHVGGSEVLLSSTREGRGCTKVSFTKETSPFGSRTKLAFRSRLADVRDLINLPRELQKSRHRHLDSGAQHVKRHPHHLSDAFDVTSFFREVTSPFSVQRQDTLISAFCSTLRGPELTSACNQLFSLEGHTINGHSAVGWPREDVTADDV